MPPMRAVPVVLSLFAIALSMPSCGDEKPAPAPVKKKPVVVAQKPAEPTPAKPAEGPWFVDEAKQRGITLLNRTGRPKKKEFIMSAVGPGAAVFDADGDGLLDIYIPNGNHLVGPYRNRFYDADDRPRNALYMQQQDGTFSDEAAARGVDDDRWAFGACAADLDNDGDQDLIVTNLSLNRLYLNDGKGRFRDVAVPAGIAGTKEEWSTGIACGDYDKDGVLDIYIANYADMFEWMRTSKDIARNEDGSIKDAAVCNWQNLKVYCGPIDLPGQQDYLYRGLGAGEDGIPRYEDVSKRTGIWRPKSNNPGGGPLYGFQALFADLNSDSWPDLYVANDSVPSYYFENQAGKSFKELANEKGIALGSMGQDMAGMGASSADLNGDGYLDIIKTNFAAQTNNLYIAEVYKGEVTFRDFSMRTGLKEVVYADLGWGALAFDFDHDGDRDIFFANGHVYPEVDHPYAAKLKMSFEQINQMFRNDSQGSRLRFKLATAEMGPGFSIKKCSRGSALLDFDNDGDIDVIVINLNNTPDLLVNKRGSESGHWLQIRLEGDPTKKTNRDAIGSKVWVTAGDLRQFFETKRGEGFLGCGDPRVHVGLGVHTAAEVEITWPNGDKTTHKFDAVDREVKIRQP